MSDTPVIAIFAASPGKAAYLSDMVRMAGFQASLKGEGHLALAEAGVDSPKTLSMPILQLGGEEREGVRVLASPAKASHVIAALQAMVRLEQGPPAKISIGEYELDTRDNLWTRAGEPPLRLTEKETAILLYMKAAGGKPVPREDLLKHVWSYVRDVETHTLETHIYRLRQKIEEDPSSPKILLTQGDGYVLAG